MHEMRRKDRAISNEDAVGILTKAEYGVLSTVCPDGSPYGVPLNFCFVDNAIYFHCAMEGRKIDTIVKNPSVSFCALGATELQPEKFATNYESVIVSGTIGEVFAQEKQAALEGLLKKYSADYFEAGLRYIENLREKTRVFKISVATLSGKARRA
jgi:nitroimidazol reductase NimA-like FMN-containing flavoprotein (pyridoxamine 5'-phosphate oxidase superfamily)